MKKSFPKPLHYDATLSGIAYEINKSTVALHYDALSILLF